MNPSEDEIRELNYKRFREVRPVIQKRLHSVYLKSRLKMSNESIATILDVHRNSVDYWIHSYLEGGLECLVSLHYHSQESELMQYSEQIKEKLSQENIQTTAEFPHRVFELTGISRGLTQMRKFMHKIGFKYRQSGHLPAKADPQKQRQWRQKSWIR